MTSQYHHCHLGDFVERLPQLAAYPTTHLVCIVIDVIIAIIIIFIIVIVNIAIVIVIIVIIIVIIIIIVDLGRGSKTSIWSSVGWRL